jgi:hypothetical protein
MRTRPDPQQAALDELGRRLNWRRGPFRSWKVRGFTISVGNRGRPRKYVVVGRHERQELATLDEVRRFVSDRATR